MYWVYYLNWIPLFWLIVQDFRSRTIPLSGLIVFGFSTLSIAWFIHGMAVMFLHILCNLILVGLLLGGVKGFLWLRHRNHASLTEKWIGEGDIGFIVCLTPLFDLQTYTWFLTLSLTATLLIYMLYRYLGGTSTTIPLVSTLGITLSVYTLFLTFL